MYIQVIFKQREDFDPFNPPAHLKRYTYRTYDTSTEVGDIVRVPVRDTERSAAVVEIDSMRPILLTPTQIRDVICIEHAYGGEQPQESIPELTASDLRDAAAILPDAHGFYSETFINGLVKSLNAAADRMEADELQAQLDKLVEYANVQGMGTAADWLNENR